MTRRRERWAELDRTAIQEWLTRIEDHEQRNKASEPPAPRRYPGYPRRTLPTSRARWLRGLDRALTGRRSHRELHPQLPPAAAIGHILRFAHGVHSDFGRGPTPSAGGLQALELYAIVLAADLASTWLPAGAYHYDRAGHFLTEIVAGADREPWTQRVPAMSALPHAPLLWIIVGDSRRAGGKYADRGGRFLLLEAGHLMQSLCLLSESLGLATLPLGGCLEPDVARALQLPAEDLVLYAGVCGRPARE
jgi:SagB-type dehydrogenase family enzyme